ncbi:hypothetical protein AYO22_04662 [Fonsecaea multimorphosa]|nr:hypothetical protein AYO22_04662 [Fonsecaea multimorphosa]
MAEFSDLWDTSKWTQKQFVSKVWLPRIDDVLKTVRMSEKELAALHEIGVKVEPEYEEMQSDGEDEFENAEEYNPDEDDTDEDDPEDSDAGDDYVFQANDESIEIEAVSSATEEAQTEGNIEAAPSSSQTIEGIDDTEVADILREAARINGLEDYDVWFKMIGKPDPRLNRGRT